MIVYKNRPAEHLGRIYLYAIGGAGLIVEAKTGTLYGNQVGGSFCLQVFMEGMFIPLFGGLKLENDLKTLFEGSDSKYRGLGAVRGIDMNDAAFINGVLARHDWAQFLEVDETNLKNSYEAWIRVKVIGGVHGLLEHFPSYPATGVLTWTNSD